MNMIKTTSIVSAVIIVICLCAITMLVGCADKAESDGSTNAVSTNAVSTNAVGTNSVSTNAVSD